MSAEETIALMRETAPPASAEAHERVRLTSAAEIVASLRAAGLSAANSVGVGQTWEAFHHDDEWSSLLASLVTMVEAQRGDIDVPIPIWDDLDDAGPFGQYLYFYLFVLCAPGAADYLRASGCRADVIERTMSALEQLSRLHERKWRSLGVETGWWLFPILRGELIQVGSLWFHRVTLGVGNLSPDPWYGEEEAAELGVGFRRGDPSIGIHIPQDTALDPASLDQTFDDARRVVASMWPTTSRRLATCQTWMLDAQLCTYLDPQSNLLAFQRRFHVISSWAPTWADGDASIIEFVFRTPGVELADLPRVTKLQRAVHDHIERGGHWFVQPGWLEFDGVQA